jgi:hypothetical protein
MEMDGDLQNSEWLDVCGYLPPLPMARHPEGQGMNALALDFWNAAMEPIEPAKRRYVRDSLSERAHFEAALWLWGDYWKFVDATEDECRMFFLFLYQVYR